MANEPVAGWDERILIAAEAAFGTQVLPASAQGIEVMSLEMGPGEAQNRRPKKDKTIGRDMTLGFVAGRVEPIPFTLATSMKSRAAVDTVPKESVLYKSGGLVETVNGGVSVAYSLSSAPTIQGLSLLTALGLSTASYAAEHGRGGLVEQLKFHGGDSEVTLEAIGKFIGKGTAGQATGTLSSDVDTTMALGAGESYRFIAPCYVQTEDEVLLVTSIDYATDILTVTRAQAGTVAAAHAATTVYPYMPTPTLTGSPISEANCTVTLDGVATRCTKFDIEITTGISHLPGETGSKYVQGGKATRVDVKPSLELVLTKELMNVFGKANQFKSVALSIVCGTGAGGIVTFSMPTCELVAMPMPKPGNDITIIAPELRVRGNAGNDSISWVLT